MEEDIKWLKEYVERDRDIRHNRTESDFDKFCERNCTAIESVLARLEQLEKENKLLEYNNATLEKQVKLMRDNFKIAVEQEIKENYIPKSVIREKIEELEGNREKIEDKYYFDYQNNIYDFIAGMKKGLQELLGEENEDS